MSIMRQYYLVRQILSVSISTIITKCWRLSGNVENLSNGAFEPVPSIECPPTHHNGEHDPERHGCVVECPERNRVCGGEHEDDARVTDPQKRDEANPSARAAEPERTRFEILVLDHHTREYGHRIPAHPSYCAD